MVDHRAVLVNKKNLDEEVRNGGGGIRTPASREAPGGFQDRSLQPDLGTPPWYTVDPVGLEPTTGRL